ncbi:MULTISPECIES: MarR family transcriptional regulator [unclassified Enterococcus]|uniref:MarR family winged helix-turn-helix transcriptional regulator n=1 Tax=unclassified Enterococcus TaxID=2608891 RepID=UPI0013EAE172|nr:MULTISPECIES: MarR family transcriptional regulator [unclassified Enterococcus]
MENRAESNLKWLAKLSRVYQKELDQKLAPLQLNSSNYYFIVKIHDYKKLKQEELIKLTGLDASNVTRTVQKLISIGLVTKEKSEQDRRSFVLELTEAGQTRYDHVIDTVEIAQKEFLSKLTSEEQELFEKLLGKLAEEN